MANSNQRKTQINTRNSNAHAPRRKSVQKNAFLAELAFQSNVKKHAIQTFAPMPGGGGTCYAGVPGYVPFSWVYFSPKNSIAGYTFCPKTLKEDINFCRKNLNQGNILLGNNPNFFVERMT